MNSFMKEGLIMAKLLYQGHGSYRIKSADNTVIYVDPYAGKGYDEPADIILVSHQHHDHNAISLVPHDESCIIITEKEAFKGGNYNKFTVKGIGIEAVPAYNKNHKKDECVGYIITVDAVKIYASGDTSTTEEMKTLLPGYKLDYALLPIDGIYNMNAEEASECAKAIGARYSIPVHMKPGELFDREMAEKFQAEGRIILEPNTEIEL